MQPATQPTNADSRSTRWIRPCSSRKSRVAVDRRRRRATPGCAQPVEQLVRTRRVMRHRGSGRARADAVPSASHHDARRSPRPDRAGSRSVVRIQPPSGPFEALSLCTIEGQLRALCYSITVPAQPHQCCRGEDGTITLTIACLLAEPGGRRAQHHRRLSRRRISTATWPSRWPAPNATVSSILSNPDQDPHLFEASPSVARLLSGAAIVVYNGADYDPWMTKLLAATRSPNRKVIVVANLVHRKPGDNPHLWYDPPTMPTFARALAEVAVGPRPVAQADYRATAARLSRLAAAARRQDRRTAPELRQHLQ